MKTTLRILLLAVPLFWAVAVFGQKARVGENFGSMVYLDGVNVVPDAEFALKRDQLLLLEAFDLKPQTVVEFRAKSGPSTVLKESITTDVSGAMHQILFFPKNHAHLKCTVKYVTKNGEDRKVDFALKGVTGR